MGYCQQPTGTCLCEKLDIMIIHLLLFSPLYYICKEKEYLRMFPLSLGILLKRFPCAPGHAYLSGSMGRPGYRGNMHDKQKAGCGQG